MQADLHRLRLTEGAKRISVELETKLVKLRKLVDDGNQLL